MEKPDTDKKGSFFSSLKETFVLESDVQQVSEVVDENEQSLASRETHEKLKKSSLDVQLKANNKRFWAGYLSKFGDHLIMSAFIGITVAAGAGLGPLVILGIFAGGLALGLTGHVIQQSANQTSAANNHDVGDYYNKRTAALNAKALKKELLEEPEEQNTVGSPYNRDGSYFQNRTNAGKPQTHAAAGARGSDVIQKILAQSRPQQGAEKASHVEALQSREGAVLDVGRAG